MPTHPRVPPEAELLALSVPSALRQVREHAIFLIDLQGRIASWNEGVGLVLGWAEADWVGQPASLPFTPDDQSADVPRHELARARDTGRAADHRWMMRRSGERFFAAASLARLRHADGRPAGYLKVLREFTTPERAEQQRMLEQALHDARRSRAEAEQASHSKGEFLAAISHELRTPLSAILGWAHLLERGVGDPALLAQGLAAISRNARVQVQLIEDLLDMNRIESGQLRLDLQPVDLAGVVAATVESMLPAAHEKGLVLRTRLDDSVGRVVGDPGRLQQVVAKLLSNAIKFTPAGGEVEVLLESLGDPVVDGALEKAGAPASEGRGDLAGHSARITVADNGQGIEAAFLMRVFERFQPLEATTPRRQGGLGIGLAVVWRLVQLHGGEIRAESPGAGRGARFTVLLPLAPAAVPMAVAEPP